MLPAKSLSWMRNAFLQQKHTKKKKSNTSSSFFCVSHDAHFISAPLSGPSKTTTKEKDGGKKEHFLFSLPRSLRRRSISLLLLPGEAPLSTSSSSSFSNFSVSLSPSLPTAEGDGSVGKTDVPAACNQQLFFSPERKGGSGELFSVEKRMTDDDDVGS